MLMMVGFELLLRNISNTRGVAQQCFMIEVNLATLRLRAAPKGHNVSTNLVPNKSNQIYLFIYSIYLFIYLLNSKQTRKIKIVYILNRIIK